MAAFDHQRLVPGSPEELAAFAALQAELAPMFNRVFVDRQAARSVVVVPSLSLDPDVMAKIEGVHHYEERMLCLLMLLKLPRTHVTYVTSQAIHESIVDYYLHLLPGVPPSHARPRLTLLSCHDASPRPLTEKILERPRLIERIRRSIPDHTSAHMSCFISTDLERSLAVQLGIPLYGSDPALIHLGDKSHSRELFRSLGVTVPEGSEHLRDEDDVAEALTRLHHLRPGARQAVVKLNEGFSGEGNATFDYTGVPRGGDILRWVRRGVHERLTFEGKGETAERFWTKFDAMGGIVEEFVEGEGKRSPSVQCRIDPLGRASIVSTHDQILGGQIGQVFLGASFPADVAYRSELHQVGETVAKQLSAEGVIGRFGVDFVSVREGDRWVHYGIEINLRKGGTTLPYLMLEFLTGGAYDVDAGLFRTPGGHARYYVSSDNVHDDAYRGLTPDDLIDISVYHDLHFHDVTQQGVVYHLMGALSEFGKLGVVCIGDSPDWAQALYDQTLEVIDRETHRRAGGPPA